MSNQEIEHQIIDNEKLVYFIINKYFYDYRADEDLIQCGRIGLWRACERFDGGKSKFSTFASKCIYNAIVHELQNRNNEWKLGCVESLDRVIETDRESGSDITVGHLIPVIEEGYCEIDYDLSSVKKKLSERDAEAFQMHLDGFKAVEIAELYGFSRSWASRVIRDAQYIARKELLGNRQPAIRRVS